MAGSVPVLWFLIRLVNFGECPFHVLRRIRAGAYPSDISSGRRLASLLGRLGARDPPPPRQSPGHVGAFLNSNDHMGTVQRATLAPASSRAAPWLLCASSIDLGQLVVPEQLCAPVIQEHVEGQVLGMTPLSDDRARKPPPLGAKPSLAHHHLRADSRFFRPHKELLMP